MDVKELLKEKELLENEVGKLVSKFFEKLSTNNIVLSDFRLDGQRTYNEGKNVISVIPFIEIKL